MSAQGFVASWNGAYLSIAGAGQSDDASADTLKISRFDAENDCGCPVVESDVVATSFATLILPAEDILIRPFFLPLKSEKHLDEEILRQELADSLGDDCGQWWLSWSAAGDGNGISGLLFGLSESSRSMLSGQDMWNRCPTITVDAWHRLNSQLQEVASEEHGELSAHAVLDADADGLFAGFFNSNGFWAGMRRINSAGRSNSSIVEDIHRSLLAMGYDPGIDIVTGRLSLELVELISEKGSKWNGEIVSDLPTREDANLSAFINGESSNTMNFRRGKWRVHTDKGRSIRAWKPTLMLLGVLLLTALAGGWYKLGSLETQVETYQQGMVDAFRRGLPNETVMLDPLAQLRAANSQTSSGTSTNSLLLDLQGLDKVKNEIEGWDITEISLSDGVVKISGDSPDFALVNRIQGRLSSVLNRNTEVVDTELNNSQVKFSIEWMLL